MSVQAKDFVRHAVVNFECDFNQMGIIKMMREDGFGELNWEELKAYLKRISHEYGRSMEKENRE